jgi:hypothetical protein
MNRIERQGVEDAEEIGAEKSSAKKAAPKEKRHRTEVRCRSK